MDLPQSMRQVLSTEYPRGMGTMRFSDLPDRFHVDIQRG
jgi:hypothetical protein